jgi:hypothetical protein
VEGVEHRGIRESTKTGSYGTCVIVDDVVWLLFEERGHTLYSHWMDRAVEVHGAKVHCPFEWGAQMGDGCGVAWGVEGDVVAPVDEAVCEEADDPLYPAVSIGWHPDPGWGYLRYPQWDLAFLAIRADSLLIYLLRVPPVSVRYCAERSRRPGRRDDQALGLARSSDAGILG